ncbi:MAG: 3-phosphoshikimate 1-carboxyvinyltransferase, partial [Xanthomonadales bacterium]|nr:3-phosphoshikimate 1-carboxyvinyltransferase [Xanthomonadales bacterium]
MLLTARPAAQALRGSLRPPGDKSISHRSLILGALAEGETRIGGLLGSADVRATASAVQQLGARIEHPGGQTTVRGLGKRGLREPGSALDMGNSGTAMRLLTGVLAAQAFRSTLTGDASLSRRPMRRIIEPLQQMGATIRGTPN